MYATIPVFYGFDDPQYYKDWENISKISSNIPIWYQYKNIVMPNISWVEKLILKVESINYIRIKISCNVFFLIGMLSIAFQFFFYHLLTGLHHLGLILQNSMHASKPKIIKKSPSKPKIITNEYFSRIEAKFHNW